MTRFPSAVFIALFVSSGPLLADGTNLTNCEKEVTEAARGDRPIRSELLCAEQFAPWEINLIQGGGSWMTDGTALGLLHLPEPDDVPRADRPLPVVLIPLSSHVWGIRHMYNEKVLPESDGYRLFIWTPGDSRAAYPPDGVEWGYDAARMFRCLSYNGERCITYYPVRKCKFDGQWEPKFVFTARLSGDEEPTEMLNSFEPVDDMMPILIDAAWAAICNGD